VIPHGELHLLPWASLTLEGRRLFESTAVGVLPNLASLALLDEPRPDAPTLTVALLGDPDYSAVADVYPPLPQVGPELTDIAALYGSAVLAGPVTGADATQEALTALLDDPRASDPGVRAVLHVACHADLDVAEPLSAGLVLTGASLDAAEILRHRCGFDDVVLSACSTGWRPQTVGDLALAGDDALGLTASFLEVGARSLLVSVPKAHDVATRAFVTAWHRHRLAGLSPLQAHRQALLERHAADPGRVWQWAGMTVHGCR
jgi:CHAT domain-containing protein